MRSSAGHLSAAAGAVIAAAITAAIIIFQQFLIPDICRFSHAAVVILLMVFLLEWEDRGCGKQRFFTEDERSTNDNDNRKRRQLSLILIGIGTLPRFEKKKLKRRDASRVFFGYSNWIF